MIQFCPTSLIYFSLSRFCILSYLDSTRTSAFVGLVAPFSCGHFSMHAGLSAALRTCVTHSSLVVVQTTDVSYRTRRNDAARLQRRAYRRQWHRRDARQEGGRIKCLTVDTMPHTYTDTRSLRRASAIVGASGADAHCYFRRETFDRER